MLSRIVGCLAVVCLISLANVASAELIVRATQPANNAVKIAISPIGVTGPALPEDISFIVSSDLARSGLFDVIPKRDFLSFPTKAGDVYYRDWSILGSQYVVVSNLERQPDGRMTITFSLMSVANQSTVFTKQVSGSTNQLRDMAHFISDAVYEAITGIPGAFSTRLAYVTATRNGQGRLVYRLNVSDADGARERMMVQSFEPIMSPDWSPDGKQLAYVSFETGRPAIFRHIIASGQREQLTNFRGLNGAPSWSPDGQQMTLVLSKDGNPEIYLYTLATKQFQRLTNHFAIDTEPTWMPDGKSILFTSDRGGSPQIYQLDLATKDLKRLTFRGNYNGRPQMAPDGRTLALVHRDTSTFHVASLDLKTGILRELTETRLDESPTIAPNGAMVIYATKQGDQGVLAAVSLDTAVKFILPTREGDVREPAWSPN